MKEILQIEDWVKAYGGEEQFRFMDPVYESSGVVERLIDGAIFFIEDVVKFKDGHGITQYKFIVAFDVNKIAVHLSDEYSVAINDIEFESDSLGDSEEFDWDESKYFDF